MHPKCRSCNGSGAYFPRNGKRLDCKACSGSGVNKKLYTTTCNNGYCSTQIVYPVGSKAPKYCKSCFSQEREKTCAQDGCYNTITFKLGWDNVSDYCKNCQGKRQNGWSPKRCNGPTLGANCNKLIWVPPGKNFTMCRECNEKAQEKKTTQWKTKQCKNCRNEIKYHVNWTKVPELCNSCKEKEQSKWREKTCKGGCGNKVKYHVDWEYPPNFCKDCKGKPGIAKTDLDHKGRGHQHTTYSLNTGLRRSFDHNKGKNIRNDHYSEGSVGTAVDKE